VSERCRRNAGARRNVKTVALPSPSALSGAGNADDRSRYPAGNERFAVTEVNGLNEHRIPDMETGVTEPIWGRLLDEYSTLQYR
jgi:hypothetical protein